MRGDVHGAKKLPILCLEDDRHIRYMLRRALAGREVDMVDRVAATREAIETKTYGAWLLDVLVPDGSGLDVLGWARRRGDRTPALVMTGLTDRAIANDAQALDAEFLYKPYSRENLDAFLERAERPRVGIDEAVQRFFSSVELPPREQDVVMALAAGVPRAHLAERLGVKENTVKTTVRKLLLRTQQKNLDELLRALLRGEL